jgi:hypothetical protein
MVSVGPRVSLERASSTGWASDVKQAAEQISLGSKALAAVAEQQGGKAVGPLASATQATVASTSQMLETLLQARFSKALSPADVGLLKSAQGALGEAAQTFQSMHGREDATRVPAGATGHDGEYFHDVGAAAAKLSAWANEKGTAQHLDFNGTRLVLKPGQDPKAAVAEWTALSKARQNPAADLFYEVRNRVDAETARQGVDAAAQQPARPLNAVLESLETLADTKHYKDEVMAGAYELKHPGEIAGFVESFMSAPPMGPGKTADAARAALHQSLTAWVDGDKVQPGTQDAWRGALQAAAKAWNLG